MELLHCLRKRKKSLFLLMAIQCVLYLIGCQYVWKYGAQIRTRRFSHADVLMVSFWNNNQPFSITIDRPLIDHEPTNVRPWIAIGCAITSKKVRNVLDSNMGAKFQFFRTFLPTFCHTASSNFVYKFYLAYDRRDPVFRNQRLSDAFYREFNTATTTGQCRDRNITIAGLSLVECYYAGKPTWSQNDAMLEAYLDHVDYFYRINDDTKMLTGGWTEKFISTLERYYPPHVGVVGPNHRGGSTACLTYDFVHRTHVDLFGFYYPRLFTDWWGDNWITGVYKPNRSTKMRQVRLVHTLGLGQRYSVRFQVRKYLKARVFHDVAVVKR